jgi:vacuolar-type H+-ATPase subunit C/Vma6
MSDIQELIHKTSMDCIEKGQAMERERIIKLLHEKAAVNWIEALEYPYYADQLEELIKGETSE